MLSDYVNKPELYKEFNNKYDYSSIKIFNHLFDYNSKVDNPKYKIFQEMTSFPPLDTSNVTHMVGMFNWCKNLKEIPMMDTSKVKMMNYMFFGCLNLSSIPDLDTSSAINMSEMFRWCHKLEKIPYLETVMLII